MYFILLILLETFFDTNSPCFECSNYKFYMILKFPSQTHNTYKPTENNMFSFYIIIIKKEPHSHKIC